MAETRHFERGGPSQGRQGRRDADGAIAAQRWAFAIVAAFAVVALLHALW